MNPQTKMIQDRLSRREGTDYRNYISPMTCRFIVAVFVLVVVVEGCSDSQSHIEQTKSAISTAPQLTENDYWEFARCLEKAAASGNVDVIMQMIDFDAIIALATTPRMGSDEFNVAFAAATKRDLVSTSIAKQIVTLLEQGGTFRCLRVHSVDGETRVLFRLLLPEKPSLDYFEFRLVRQPDGQVRANDYYCFRTGDNLSEAIRRQYQWIAASASTALKLQQLTKEETEVLKSNRMISDMQELSSSGHPKEALEIYGRLPAALQNDKSVLLTRLESAVLIGGKVYDDAMLAIRSSLPSDPCLDFILLDYYALHRQFDMAHAVIDRLNKRIGGDPQQDVRHALCYMMEGKNVQAREYAQKAIAAEDTLLSPYCVLLQIALHEKDFDEVSRLLTVVEGKSIMAVPDLPAIPIYAEFVQSPQYKTWLRKTHSR